MSIIYKLHERSDTLTYDTISDVINTAFSDIHRKGVSFAKNNISGKELEQVLISNKGSCFVALENDQPVGTISIVHKMYSTWFCKGEAMRFRYLAVLPDKQGQHVASGLLNVAMDYCKSYQAKIVTVSTPSNNTAAIHFYQKKGFIKVRYWWNRDHSVIDFAIWTGSHHPSRTMALYQYQKSLFKTKIKRLMKL